jgi:hypothetical protein
MKSFGKICVLTIMAVVLGAGGAIAQQKEDAKDQKGSFILKTKDGSSLKCKPQAASIPISTAYAKMDLQFSQIASLEFGAETNKATVKLQNGDKLQGTIGIGKLVVSTLIGDLTVQADQIVSITSVSQDKKEPEIKDSPEAKRRCINNLRQIDSAKEQYSLAANLDDGAKVTGAEIGAYLNGGWDAMKCPAGGKYTISPVGDNPKCSVPGHQM